MPYKIVKHDDEECVHVKNEDGSVGGVVPGGCHKDHDDAVAHMAALYINVDGGVPGEDLAVATDTAEDEGVDDCDGCEEVDANVAMMFASLPDAKFYVEDDDGNTFPLEGKALPKRYVRRVLFENMSVAVAERNANGDVISIDNLGELAATIRDMPISDRHPRRGANPTIFGTISKGWVAHIQRDGGDRVSHLMTSGAFWAGRNPTLVRETIQGVRRPSIEAYSQEEGCSVCGGWFDSSDQYCPHLQPVVSGMRLPDNVSRLHRGLVAAGAANVHNPAGSDVGFHSPRFFLSADMKSVEETTEMPMPDETNVATPAPAPENPNDQVVSRLEAEKSDLETLVTASKAQLDLLRTRVIAMIDAGINTDKIKSMTADDRMLDMSDVTFTLVCETLAAAPATTTVPAPAPAVMADTAPAPAGNHKNIGGFKVTAVTN